MWSNQWNKYYHKISILQNETFHLWIKCCNSQVNLVLQCMVWHSFKSFLGLSFIWDSIDNIKLYLNWFARNRLSMRLEEGT